MVMNGHLFNFAILHYLALINRINKYENGKSASKIKE